jgi:16S rRNA (guanine527-N7)-methyltransferase
MTEDEARAWLAEQLAVPRETMDRLSRFIALLRAEADKQNLIAASTFDSIWSRHIVDSAQLLPLVGRAAGSWLDLGSGAGFPGLVVALLGRFDVTLVESRRKRTDFLTEVVRELDIAGATVAASRAETLPPKKFDVISARAFAPLDRLLALAHRFAPSAAAKSCPDRRSAASELEAVRGSWQGMFRIEPSVTDPEAAIIVATGVQPKPKGTA